MARLLGEIGRVGNNLNQIAHALNSGGVSDDTRLTVALAELPPVREAILAALGRDHDH